VAPQSHGLRKLVPFIIITANRCGVEGLMEEKETKHLTADLLAVALSSILAAGNLAQLKYVIKI
jgi:nucleoside recognition membrane protein YjiH